MTEEVRLILFWLTVGVLALEMGNMVPKLVKSGLLPEKNLLVAICGSVILGIGFILLMWVLGKCLDD